MIFEAYKLLNIFNMKKITLLLAMLVVSFGYSQTLPIDFEESDDSNIFASVSDGGTFNIIDDADNAGESVGEFSGKVGGALYDHINVPLTTSLDIAATNTISFRVKQTTTEGTTSHLFKLQPNGGTGSNQEVAFTTEYDVWKDVSLTYSGTGTYNELIIFFDFNSASVSGTYLIDDIVASSGTPAAAYDLPFDFETSPVTSDWEGFEGAGITVEAVAAPQTTGNSSTNLAKIIRNGGQTYAGVVTAVDTPLDFSTKSTITARIWTSAPIGTKIMFKTEEAGNAGNNSGEKDVFTTKTGEWEDLVFDFAGVTNASQTRIVIIPDNGNLGDGSATSTFFFDDIIQEAPVVSYDLPFDFETSPVTSDWEGFEGAGITVEAVAAPQTTGNSSTNLAKIIRNGGQTYAGVVTAVDTPLDFSTKSTITARIWTSAPIGTKIMFKTEEAGNAGNNSGEKDVFTTKTGEWEDLVFDFAGVTNASQTRIVIIPDNGNLGDGSATSTFFFDDIIQEAPVVSYDLPFDFETSPVTSDWEGFEGAGITVEAVAAPQTTGNSSTNLAKIIRNGGQTYAGVVTAVDTPLDFSTKSTITARIWTSAPIGTKIMFKTEEAGNAGNNSGEKDVFTTKTGEWEDLVFDFAGVTNASQTRIVIIPDNGNLGDGSATSTFFFDDIIQEAPVVSYDLPFDFETSPVTSDWEGFEGAGITVEAVAAPQTTGNSSTNLAKIIRNGGQTYAGVVTAVDTPLDFSTKSTITARIWTSAPIGTKIMFKTEEAGNADNNSGEKDVFTTKTGEWEDLVFDFAGVTNASQTRIVIIPDNGNLGDGSATSTFFFDDIIQEAPATAGVNDNNTLSVSVYPNPSSSNWNFRTPNTVIKSVEVFNLLGKRVASQRNNNSTEASISTQGLSSGIYIARITTEQGAKSVKLIKN